MFRFNFPRICQAIHKEVKHFANHSQENKSVKLNKLMLRKELFFFKDAHNRLSKATKELV